MHEDTKFGAFLQDNYANNSQQKESFSSSANLLFQGMARP
jgi:hypothetical protein